MPTQSEERDTLIVVPCYNESRRLDVAAIDRFVGAHPTVRFLFVDDGSKDATPGVLEGLASRHPGLVSWKRLARNSGKAEAVRQGVVAGLAEAPALVAYWDADFATPLDVIDDFVEAFRRDPGLLGVFGSRVRRLGADIDRKPFRHYAGRVFATFASMVLGIAVYDTQCGAKMFRSGDELARAFAEPFDSEWIFDVEVLARLKRILAPAPLAPRLYEFPLGAWHDVAGSKLTTARGAAAFVDLWRIWRKYR
jgi:dolichyl-phosphate beta-glucosyltransferase